MRALVLAATFYLGTAFLGVSSTASLADFSVCNSTGGQIRLAFGHNDSRLGWTSRGWWNVSAGACQKVLTGDIPPGNYYVHAIDGADQTLPVPDAQVGGTFCTRDSAFDLRSSGFMTPQNTIACEANGLKGTKFRVIEVRETSPNYSYALAPMSNGTVVSNGPAAGALTLPPSQPSASGTQAPAHPAPPTGTACQRYPNLC